MFKAGRHNELLELWASDLPPISQDTIWSARILEARGLVDEAIAYARERAGRRAEAFDHFALLANLANSHLSIFRALARKYAELAPDGLFDHLTRERAFAMQAALAALHWISIGHGYELTGLDAHEAHRLVLDGVQACHQTGLA